MPKHLRILPNTLYFLPMAKPSTQTLTGGTLRAVRKASGLTLEALAERAGTSAGYLSRVERGQRNPSTEWVRAVTQAIGTRLAEAS